VASVESVFAPTARTGHDNGRTIRAACVRNMRNAFDLKVGTCTSAS
jgi:hypothetical protein